jgi:hypothetical protein
MFKTKPAVVTFEEITTELDGLLAKAEMANLDRSRLVDLLESRCFALRMTSVARMSLSPAFVSGNLP